MFRVDDVYGGSDDLERIEASDPGRITSAEVIRFFLSDKAERADHACMMLHVRLTDIGWAAVCPSDCAAYGIHTVSVRNHTAIVKNHNEYPLVQKTRKLSLQVRAERTLRLWPAARIVMV